MRFRHMANNTLALKILEYVPAAIPMIIASTKSLVVSPPKKYRANMVNKAVNEVLMLRAKVWLMLMFTILTKGTFLVK